MLPPVIHCFGVWGATAMEQRYYLQMRFHVLMCSLHIHVLSHIYTENPSLVNIKNIEE